MPKEPFTNIYDLDYFTGSQMFLYIGDVWVDEITSLQYVTQQTKSPIYGYASQLWDDASAGHVVVQGSFTINFKEQGYLWAVLRRFNKVRQIGSGKDRNPIFMNKQGQIDNIKRASIERILQGNVPRGELYDFYFNLASFSTFDVKQAKDKVFEDVAEAFEDEIWKQPDDTLNSQVRRTDDNQFDGFDMYIVWGNYANARANHTVQKIIDVRLMSQGKSIAIDGQPIQEAYQFIAQSTV